MLVTARRLTDATAPKVLLVLENVADTLRIHEQQSALQVARGRLTGPNHAQIFPGSAAHNHGPPICHQLT